MLTHSTLIANGDHHRMVSSVLSEALHRRVKGSQLIIYPDSGHITARDQPPLDLQPTVVDVGQSGRRWETNDCDRQAHEPRI